MQDEDSLAGTLSSASCNIGTMKHNFATQYLKAYDNCCYPFRVTTIRDAEHRNVSEVVSFTTRGCEPDPPLAPKLISRTKNSLNLQWKRLGFQPKYNGEDLSCIVRNLQRNTAYTFHVCGMI
ncbi:Fibronectin type III domain containing protein 3C1 [Lemmus lemmus]